MRLEIIGNQQITIKVNGLVANANAKPRSGGSTQSLVVELH